MDDLEKGEHVKDVYAHFGLATYLSQVLEYGIVNSMVYFQLIPEKAAGISSEAEWGLLVDEYIDKHFEKTLGQMIKSLMSAALVPDPLKVLLGDSLSRRNWLAHGYFRDRAAEFMTKDGRDSMIAELEEAQSLFRRADSELEIAIKPLRKRYGHTEEKLKHYYDEYLKEIGVMPS